MTEITDLRLMEFKVAGAVRLVTETCYACGVLFAMPVELRQNRRETRDSFYCPNGHGMAYTVNEAERLRKELTMVRQTVEWEQERANRAEGSLRATKAVVTRMKRRAMAGACPFGCHRTFVDLQRHIVSKHADETVETAGEVPA